MSQTDLVKNYDETFPVATIQYEDTKLLYGVPNTMALMRVSSFDTKEPETIKWLAGFSEGDIFLDIGANMGIYAIFAAVHAGARVFAFEPESQNYALLNRNIAFNKVSDRMVAWCCALSDGLRIDRLYLSKLKSAGSGHEFGAEVNPNLKPSKAAYVQGSVSFALDDLIQQNAIPVPTHIKVDVDGFEHLVVAGALATLRQDTVRSILIEINPHLEEHTKLVEDMRNFGFTFDPDQVERARRKDGNTKGYAEYIFWR